MMPIFNDANFEQEVVEASKIKPVIVDFFAPWCGTCKMMEPIIEEIAEENKEQVLVVKVNAEESPIASEKYNVMSLPVIALFKNGQLEKSINGIQSKESILDMLK
jgi:thioredoxin 1